jgi:hypothetical protein
VSAGYTTKETTITFDVLANVTDPDPGRINLTGFPYSKKYGVTVTHKLYTQSSLSAFKVACPEARRPKITGMPSWTIFDDSDYVLKFEPQALVAHTGDYVMTGTYF